MKKVLLALIVTGIASSCATLGLTSDRGQVLRTAAFDHSCPAEKIDILAEQEEGIGAASFRLNVCGKQKLYKRFGTMYFDSEKGSGVSGVR